MREFLNYVSRQQAQSELVEAIENAVQAAIADDEGRMMYMTLPERDQANIEKGRQQGVQQGKQEGRWEGIA